MYGRPCAIVHCSPPCRSWERAPRASVLNPLRAGLVLLLAYLELIVFFFPFLFPFLFPCWLVLLLFVLVFSASTREGS